MQGFEDIDLIHLVVAMIEATLLVRGIVDGGEGSWRIKQNVDGGVPRPSARHRPPEALTLKKER